MRANNADLEPVPAAVPVDDDDSPHAEMEAPFANPDQEPPALEPAHEPNWTAVAGMEEELFEQQQPVPQAQDAAFIAPVYTAEDIMSPFGDEPQDPPVGVGGGGGAAGRGGGGRGGRGGGVEVAVLRLQCERRGAPPISRHGHGSHCRRRNFAICGITCLSSRLIGSGAKFRTSCLVASRRSGITHC